jgi:DNA ligase D-like protein (predicted 3'-phosphoesterase)
MSVQRITMAGREPLNRYRTKRDFTATAEPEGSGTRRKDRGHFVIQHHAARSDHFDFRLEIDGVLASWAVPKGPSTDPRDKRMARRTEDHPLDYETFEGTIPSGQYGAGTVQVWDRGGYENLTRQDDEPVSAADALDLGHISFRLDGQKLHGGYALTRIRGGAEETWLLVKHADDAADARRRPTRTQPKSVTTGRSMDQIGQEG